MKVIFIPGLLCTRKVWGELNDLRNKYDCYDADIGHSNSIEEMSESIAEQYLSEDVAVIGISMGGYVAIDLALRVPKRIKKLVLINTTADSVNEATIADRQKGMTLAEAGLLQKVLKMQTGICYYQPKQEWLLLEEEMADSIGAEAYTRQQKAIISRKNYSNAIKNITSETLIISGREDKVTSYKDSLYMFENISKANLVLLGECGHLSTLEKSAVVKNHVISFLEP